MAVTEATGTAETVGAEMVGGAEEEVEGGEGIIEVGGGVNEGCKAMGRRGLWGEDGWRV